MTSTAAATTPSQILQHTTAFLNDVVSQRDLRCRLISTLHRVISDQTTTTVNHLKLANDTLEAAITFSNNTAARSTSLSLAEKLLLRLPESPLASFLLSLVLTIRNRHTEAATSFLRIFLSDPSLARSEIAPVIYDLLFSLHLGPVFRQFEDRRSWIVSSKSLSKMSEEEARKLRDLEREYEEVVDENCKVVAVYFKEVLENEHKDASIDPPLLTLSSVGEGDETEEIDKAETLLLKNERHNAKTFPKNKHLKFLVDGVAKYTNALRLELDVSNKGLDIRSKRFTPLVEDIKVKVANIKNGGEFTISSVEETIKAF
ncbi:hypothetical protein RJT34_18366 [Clitoria ternatea]|uniref:Putative E3 ubiquitin-protein ligase LIN N-terminal domain-containing protein n=1 Tax=Clitoria ternatea TaxID=43366 RepID=A0AAN9PFR5_CLITE